MEKNEERFNDIKAHTEYLKNVSVTPYNFKEHFEDIMAFNSNYATQLKELLRKEQQAINEEDKINESLKRQGKNIMDATLSLQNSNELRLIIAKQRDTLRDFRDIATLLIDIFYVGMRQAKNALDMAKGAEVAKEMATEQKKLFSDIFERVDGLRVRDLARAEEMNQRILESHEHTIGQLVAKLDIVLLAKSCNEAALIKIGSEYRKKEDDYESEAQDLSRKEQDAKENIDTLKETYEEKLKQETSDKEKIKKEYEARIESLNRDLSEIQSKEKTVNAKAINASASAEVIEAAVQKKDNTVYNEAFWKNRLKKKYPVALELFKNNGDAKLVAEKCGLAQGYVCNIKTYMKKNHLQRKFEEFVGTMDAPKPVIEKPSQKVEAEKPESEFGAEVV